MKYFILVLGIVAVAFVSYLNFFPNDARYYVYKLLNKKDYVVAIPNDYYINDTFSLFENYTDDVSNKQELINYIYYVVNSGATYADGACTKEYINCTNDIASFRTNQDELNPINNFVHPFNSFSQIDFEYNDYGEFSLTIHHIYSEDEIAAIDYTVDNQIKLLIPDGITNVQKIKNIHDYIIDNTKYDTLKADNSKDDTYKSNTAYGVLFQGYGICSGYADTMAIFLNKLGINNYRISNDTHIWNLVYVNGKWVHLDATWDDPVSEFNENRDTYFLISYDELVKLDDDTHSFDKNLFKEALG